MFKKLMEMMGNQEGEAPAAESASAEGLPNLDNVIRVFDAFGREFHIPKDEWCEKVLPQQIQENWDDPNQLYQLITLAYNDGLNQPVEKAVQRLAQLEPDSERTTQLKVVNLLQAEKWDEAEPVITSWLEKHPESGIFHVYLSEVYAARDDKAKAKETLWKGLQHDPNQEFALNRWGMLHTNNPDDEANYVKAMQEAALVEGSWRPQLWLGRQSLQNKDLESAMQYYDHVLQQAADVPDVLTMISGDLGLHGYVSEILERVLPRYKPEVHGPGPGMNFLQAYLELKNYEAGETLLHQLFLIAPPTARQSLMFYSEAFERLKDQMRTVQVPEVDENTPVSVGTLLLNNPLWTYGLKQPAWLLPGVPDRAGEIGFLVLTNVIPSDVEGADAPQLQKEDDLGRLTRALPLYLCESFWMKTRLQPSVLLPMVEQLGPLVYGRPWEWAEIEQFCQSVGGGYEHIVTGAISRESSGKITCTLEIWDILKQTKLKSIVGEAPGEEALNQLLARLEAELLLVYRDYWVAPPAWYPSDTLKSYLYPYLTGLAQLLMFLLIRQGVMPKDVLWGERNMLEYFLNLTINLEAEVLPQLMLLSGLSLNKELGSDLYQEYREPVRALLERQPPDSIWGLLSPLVLEVFDMPDAAAEMAQQRLTEPNLPETYRLWLQQFGGGVEAC